MSKEKILIFGITGMAGHVIFKYLSDLGNYHIVGTSFRRKFNEDTILLDITDFHEVKKVIERTKPRYVINAIGVLIKGSQHSASNAILVNSYFPHFLEQSCKLIGAKLIHISTDCVFSGNDYGNYKEDSFRDGDDVYARSKALGEIINDSNLTIRTSIIGPELKGNGEGLFHWFMKQDGEIGGYANAFWSGVTTLELAKGIHRSILNDITGIFHLTNNTKISKYKLLRLFKDIWQKKTVTINKVENKIKDKSFINTRYPEFTVAFSYKEMLIEQREFMLQNKEKFNYIEEYGV
ncbi:dTDP-4-dehydrorhamnose reductase family protein [Spongiimicrobium sp. 3-5]|uniref:dTDP-4-dehydrorhamnose reductase family protein n=1 Tax=Spongiimicrobium sp. 3-5 TaxID=3332596 RepID=UPI00398066C5